MAHTWRELNPRSHAAAIRWVGRSISRFAATPASRSIRSSRSTCALSAENAGAAASHAQYDDVRQGRYPFAPYLHLYVRSAPDQPVDSVVKEYLRLALSFEGQRIIEELKDGKQSYVPLTAEQTASELAKIR